MMLGNQNFWAILPGELEALKADLQSKMVDGKLPEIPVDPKAEAPTDGESLPIGMYARAGDVAVIAVIGPLMRRVPGYFRYYRISATGYPDIQAAIDMAESDEAIKSIEMHIDSPGGQTLGNHEACLKIKSAVKPTKAIVRDLATSAAYSLACSCDSIELAHKGTMVGSVGVMANMAKFEWQYNLASRDAPNKNPDPSTTSGQAAIQDMLDGIGSVFIGDIAAGRGISVEDVRANYGGGAIVMAADALEAGMVDAVKELEAAGTQPPQRRTTAGANAGGQIKESRMEDTLAQMTPAKLQQEAPGLYSQITEVGAKAERERVEAFAEGIGISEASTKYALESIKSGAAFNTVAMMKINKFQIAASAQSDMDDGQTNLDPGNTNGNADTADADAVDEASRVAAAKLGIKVEGGK